MSFPKAKRFVEHVSDIPPPGTYDVPISLPDPNYKRVGMLERAGRFVERDNGPDTFGLYDTDISRKENHRPRASSALGGLLSTDRLRQQMDDQKHRLQAQHEKDIAKLQAKVTRLEASRDEAVRDKSETAKEILSLKAEIRALTSSLTSTTAKLTKSDTALSKHTALLPQLQTQLETLSSSHADSRKRKEHEIADLKATVIARDEELATVKEDSRNWRSQARALARSRVAEADIAATVISSLRSELASVRVGELHTARLRILRLERQLGDSSAQIDALGQYSAQVGEEADMLRAQLASAENDRAWALAAWKAERDDRRSDKEWRQRTRSDQREILGLREDVAFLTEFQAAERVIDDAAAWVGKERRSALEAEKLSLEDELEVAEGELDLAVNEEIPRLEANLENMTQRAEDSQQQSEELQKALTVADAGIQELQARAVEDHERFEGEIEEMSRKLAEKEKEADKERSEKKRVAGLLGQSRAAQDGLREELDLALAEVARMSEVTSQHKDLCRTIDQLARQNAATEQDNRLLVDQNTELISHGNPHQKIKHVAQIREELAESRRNHHVTTSVLASTESENAALRAELEAYRSISPLPSILSKSARLMGPPATVPTRSKVSRPALDDVYNPSLAASVPQFVISEEPQAYGGEPERERERGTRFLSSSARSASSNSENIRSSSSNGPAQQARAGLSLRGPGEWQKAKTAAVVKPRPSGGGVRMEGRMTIDELLG